MAELTGTAQVFHGNTTIVDTTQKAELGTRAWDSNGNEFIYLQGVGSTVAGDWVVFDEDYATTRVVADEVGPIAIAMAAVNATTSYGWYQIFGKNEIARCDTVAADKSLYIDGTAGRVDDAGVTGDLIIGAYSMTADSSNICTVWITYPSVSNDLGGGVGGSPGGADTNVQFNDAGSFGGDADFTYNSTTNIATIGGGLRISAGIAAPTTNDAAALGSTTLGWADLHLATGATINIANGDWLATHSAGVLTVGTGDLRITTAGTNAASVVTVGGAQTLTSKTLTSPTIGTSPTAAGATWTDLGTVTTADINGGTIDGVTIGGASAGAITGTTITANTGFMPDANDGAYLGQAGTAFSDLFLAEGAVINWDSGDATITQTGNVLAIAGADLRVATADVGTDNDSVPTLSSTSTLTNKTLTSPTINTASFGGHQTMLENAAFLADPVLSADGKYNGWVRAGTAGAALAFGDLCYLDPTDSRWELTDGNAAAGADGDARGVLGICVLAAAADGDPTIMLRWGWVRADTAFPTFTVNDPVYVSETAGDVTGTQPTTTDAVIRIIGKGETGDELFFSPDNVWTTHT